MPVKRHSSAPWGGLSLAFALAAAGAAAFPFLDATVPPDVRLAAFSGASGGAALAGLFGLLAGRQRRLREEKLAADLAMVSKRLLRLEARVAAPGTAEPTSTRAEQLATEVAGDLGAVSRLVAALAQTVSEHHRTLERLRDLSFSHGREQPARSAPAAAAVTSAPLPELTYPEPEPPPQPRELRSREDFARAAAAIMRKLGGHAAQADSAADALRAGRIELLMQPIVSLPQRRTVLYETFARLKADQGDIEAAEALPSLAPAGLVPALDEAVASRTLSVARYLIAQAGIASVSCKLSGSTLRDGAATERLFALLAGAPEAAQRLIFELRRRDLDLGVQRTALDRLRARGATFALDGADVSDREWPAIASAGFLFVKVSGAELLGGGAGSRTADLLRNAASAGLRVIATGIDREATVPELIDADVPLAQGEAFGPRRPVRTQLLDPLPSLDLGRERSIDAPLLADRPVPLREFLRRAG